VHFVMVGMGLYFFGAEGARIPPFTDGGVTWGRLCPVPDDLDRRHRRRC
jgi:hypothetical protein